ncbi:fumarylacetoacetate hydrolase [Sphaerisporangium siamense]|uniref:2-keto-4-pentenoate hydratase/2-oxohepta-3-ene-1,7-dioic acid hydratase in catechol pathway n=1 Tax=Sphaerisporangium siamense TaxID=795645 RepID=A0A7W7DBL0_9ACTN|nr:fumarylacetoacetate hydrolase family protein [Sphaerisporangium siamense]MBB4703828.1 2-keto-4-pentenoate hydratase/2-oxohepta-3-ene-1,7-dioic acid hydratase in catechol pathway [Sphaerisporangium siamense]GII82297.1 fumarylacetoacetate hydrolase [Sphaerisporangium siamense]
MRIGNVGGRALLITGDDTGIDIATASEGAFGPSMQSLYDRWTDFRAWAARAPLDAGVRHFTEQQIGAPAPSPRQVFAIGLNYAEHAGESGVGVPEEPAVFTKFPTSLTGPVTEVTLPDGNVDWEVELVVVIGREARNISPEQAWDHVAGVTAGQDLSERRLQHVGPLPQFSLAKSYPGFGPTGPFLVTVDELDNPDDLAIGCAVNSETVQKSRTRHMIFSVPVLLAKLSAVAPLLPGDVIFSGTPSGVGGAQNPPRFLAPGDTLVSFVENVGRLTQTFVSAQE